MPHEFIIKTLTTMQDAAEAIGVMRVRGAPLIGATTAYGMALAAEICDDGIPVHVWVDETRPRNQGAALTAWEL